MSTKEHSARRGSEDLHDGEYEPSASLRLAWLIGLTVWMLCAAAMISFSPSDPPGHRVAPHLPSGQVENWIGAAGAFVAHHVFLMIGSGAWLLLLSAAFALVLVAYRGPLSQVSLRAIGVSILAVCLSSLHALLLPTFGGGPEGAGGLLGITVSGLLSTRFGTLGALLWLLLLGAVGATVAFDKWLVLAPAYLAHAVESFVRHPGRVLVGAARERADAFREARVRLTDVDDAPQTDEELAHARSESRRRIRSQESVVIEADAGGVAATVPFDPRDHEESIAAVDPEREITEEELRAKIQKLPVVFGSRDARAANEEDLLELRAQQESEQQADRTYEFPSLELLINPETNFSTETESFVRDQAQALERALHTYRIKGEVVGIESGPVITLYQVRLAPGTKVSSIQSVCSDIARSLKSMNVRIVPNTEGTDTVGIEVPNSRKEKVRLKELMRSSDATAKMRLPLFLGKDSSGTPLIQDLAAMPHMLIAGTTGSGKSVCMSAIIMGFLYTQKPSDLKLILVDPKMVELNQFRDIPHLMCPVVTEMGKAAAILEWAVTKMDERYELLSEAGCRDICSYNTLEWEEKKERLNPSNELEEAKIPRKLPYIVFIIDELADLMMTNKEVEGAIVRIAQKARAVGIHLILATQRPQANVVTGLIKSNMPARVAFKVASGMDSRIVLDQKGGEVLLGQGDMLMVTPRSSTAMRAQGTLVDDGEIRRVVRYIREVSSPTFERQLLQLRSGTGPDDAPGDKSAAELTAEEHESRMRQSAQEDPLFNRAVEIVLETRRGSVSLLQRRLAIGYTRASRLIELMGYAGIIGEHKGSVAREVLLTIEQWDAMKQLSSPAETEETSSERTGVLFETEPPAIVGSPDEQSGGWSEADDTSSVLHSSERGSEIGDAAKDTAGNESVSEDGDDETTEAEAGTDEDAEYEYEYEYVDEGEEEDPEAEYEYEYVDEEEDSQEADETVRGQRKNDEAPSLDVRTVRLRDGAKPSRKDESVS